MNARHSVVTLAACAALAAAGCTPQAETPADAPKAAPAPPTMKMTTDIPASVTAPDTVDSSIGTLDYFDGVPKKATVETVYDYLDRSRAVNVYLNSIPALSINALREGQAGAGCAASHQVCIFDTLMDSTSLILTGNTSTMYAVGFLDLQKDGPTVVDLPQRMLGILDDMAFLYMTDLGVAGPDKGQGGKFLVLPPGYTGDVPGGYFVVPSKTYGVWLFMRGYLDKGIEAASENIRNNLKVYPLAKASNPPTMEFVNVSGKEVNTVLPNDVSAFEKLRHPHPAGAGRLPGAGSQGHDGRHRHRQGPALQPRRADEGHPDRCRCHRQRRRSGHQLLAAGAGAVRLRQGQRVGHGLREQGHDLHEERRS